MISSITIMIGGIQGEGVVSTGVNLMKTFSSLGYYTYANRNFSSRIKGGNTTITMNISVDRISATSDQLDVILAMDLETIERYHQLLKKDGVIFYDSELQVDKANLKDYRVYPLPITSISKGHGLPNLKSTTSLTFLGRFLAISEEALKESIKARYKRKGSEIIEKNIEVITDAYNMKALDWPDFIIQLLPPKDTTSRAVILGNEAISLGALAGGCRFIASYPITPASEIMEYLGRVLPRFGGIMLQVEDEIAAVNAIVGASYAGVRSMTATSGPGISLMLEGIGLSGMAEIPIVIVDAQRAGPSTGLPTKHEQSDLFTLYYGGHGEYPSIILTPSTIEECFNETIRAFNLADIYQCPVILLTDLTLSLAPQTMDSLDINLVSINRGSLINNLSSSEALDSYKRYAYTSEGISPRVVPGVIGGLHHVTGLEHNEKGSPNDLPENRRKMMEKRMKKITVLSEGKEIEFIKNEGNDTLFLTFGSTYGVLEAAVQSANNSVDYGRVKMIKPLPLKQLGELFRNYERIVIVENNFSGQLAQIIKANIGYHDKIKSLVKYDGNPFTIEEIIKEIGGAY